MKTPGTLSFEVGPAGSFPPHAGANMEAAKAIASVRIDVGEFMSLDKTYAKLVY